MNMLLIYGFLLTEHGKKECSKSYQRKCRRITFKDI